MGQGNLNPCFFDNNHDKRPKRTQDSLLSGFSTGLALRHYKDETKPFLHPFFVKVGLARVTRTIGQLSPPLVTSRE